MHHNTHHHLYSPSSPPLHLLPYSPHHVPTYHTWMLCPLLREATASEPLTLPQEHQMQQSWRQDGDKLTFITSRPQTSSQPGSGLRSGDEDSEAWLGDVNAFFSVPEEGNDEVGEGVGVVVELELMVAREEWRGCGYGKAAVRAFLGYVVVHWEGLMGEFGAWSRGQGRGGAQGVSGIGIEAACLVVKMKEGNRGSIALFESLGFEMQGKGANYFGEVEMRLRPTNEWMKKIKAWFQQCELLQYVDEGTDVPAA